MYDYSLLPHWEYCNSIYLDTLTLCVSEDIERFQLLFEQRMENSVLLLKVHIPDLL